MSRLCTAHRLSSKHHQPLHIESVMVGRRNDAIDVVATRSEDGREVVLHIVNLSTEPQSIDIDFGTFGKIRKAEKWSIAGAENDRNTPADPLRIAPQAETIDSINAPCHLRPYSYTVIAVKR